MRAGPGPQARTRLKYALRELRVARVAARLVVKKSESGVALVIVPVMR